MQILLKHMLVLLHHNKFSNHYSFYHILLLQLLLMILYELVLFVVESDLVIILVNHSCSYTNNNHGLTWIIDQLHFLHVLVKESNNESFLLTYFNTIFPYRRNTIMIYIQQNHHTKHLIKLYIEWCT